MFYQPGDLRFLIAKHFFAPYHIQGQVPGHSHDPGGGIFRDAVERPGLQRPGERFLDHILGQVEMLDPKYPRQRRNHLSRLMPEKMLHHLGNVPRWRSGVDDFSFTHRMWPGIAPVLKQPRQQVALARRSAERPQPEDSLRQSGVLQLYLRILALGNLWRWPPPRRDCSLEAKSSRQ